MRELTLSPETRRRLKEIIGRAAKDLDLEAEISQLSLRVSIDISVIKGPRIGIRVEATKIESTTYFIEEGRELNIHGKEITTPEKQPTAKK